MKNWIPLSVATVLLASILLRVPAHLAYRLSDALIVQGVIPAASIYKLRSAMMSDLAVPPTAVYVSSDLSQLNLYRDGIPLGVFFLEVSSTPKQRRGVFPFRQTWGRVRRYEFCNPIRDGMTVKVHQVVLNATYLIFYDLEGNYVGYWLIVWET